MRSNIIKHPDVEIEIDKDLKKYSTMRLEARGDLITVKSVDGLKVALKTLTSKKIKYRALGWGANVLLPLKADIPYIQLDFEFDRSIFDTPKNEYILPASVSLATLTSHANKFGIKGWEVFTGIPATLGGAIYMNAGTGLGEIGSIVKEIKLITKNGEDKSVIVDKNSFSYRHNNFVDSGDIIYEARLINFGLDKAISKKIREYLEMRNRTQPLKEWTCGCIFKNHHDPLRDVTCRAGLFIDIIGLKGLTIKNLKISPKHANFMENSGESSYEDVKQMIFILQKEMKLQFGVLFETEVEF